MFGVMVPDSMAGIHTLMLEAAVFILDMIVGHEQPWERSYEAHGSAPPIFQTAVAKGSNAASHP